MKAIRLAPILGLVSLLGVVWLSGCGPSESGAGGGAGGGTAAEPEAVTGAVTGTEAETEAETEAVTGTEAVTEAETDLDPPGDGALDLTGWTVGAGHRDIHTLAWRLVDREAVPRNEEFELEVLILRDEVPQPGLRLAVSGWMPAHDHGMVRSPLIEEVGDGRYLISGMLLHMRGHWQVRLQVFAGRDTETATFDVEL